MTMAGGKYITVGFKESKVEELVKIITKLFHEEETLEILNIYLDDGGNLIFSSDLGTDIFSTTKLKGNYAFEDLKEAVNRLRFKRNFLVYYTGINFYILRFPD